MTVRFDVSSEGNVHATPDAVPSDDGMAISQSRYARSGRLSSSSGPPWTYHSVLDSLSWSAKLDYEADGSDFKTYELGEGAITGAAQSSSTVAACVRVAHKRPWVFRPTYRFIAASRLMVREVSFSSLDLNSLA